MKLVSISKMLLAGALALTMATGVAVARQKSKTEYPNATREAPKIDLHRQSDADTINQGLKAYQEGDNDTAKKLLQPFADGKGTNSKYAQVVALQILGNIAYKEGKVDEAIQDLEKALSLKVMPNDTYFNMEFELAQFYQATGKYQKSVDLVDKWREEGKLETAKSYGLQGLDYYNLGQYDKAITAIKKAQSMTDKPNPVWDQVLAASYAQTGNSAEAVKAANEMLAKNPDDPKAVHNAISVLVGAQKYADALKLMETAKAKGMLTDGKDYVLLAKLHMIKAQDMDKPKPETDAALAVLKEGIDKGLVKPSFDTYQIQGNAYYLNNDVKDALTQYEQASKLATDGQMDLQVASLLVSEGSYSKARKYAKSALKRGVKHPGKAYVVLAAAEQHLHNKNAAVAAMKEAEKDPATKDEARKWLKKAGR